MQTQCVKGFWAVLTQAMLELLKVDWLRVGRASLAVEAKAPTWKDVQQPQDCLNCVATAKGETLCVESEGRSRPGSSHPNACEREPGCDLTGSELGEKSLSQMWCGWPDWNS